MERRILYRSTNRDLNARGIPGFKGRVTFREALFMGQAGVPWAETSWRYIDPGFTEKPQLSHHALQDALDQAELFKKILRDINTKTTSPGEKHP